MTTATRPLDFWLGLFKVSRQPMLGIFSMSVFFLRKRIPICTETPFLRKSHSNWLKGVCRIIGNCNCNAKGFNDTSRPEEHINKGTACLSMVLAGRSPVVMGLLAIKVDFTAVAVNQKIDTKDPSYLTLEVGYRVGRCQ